MNENDTYNPKNPLRRLWGLIKLEKKNIYYIYFYAVINGLLYLSLPLGIQAIMSFMLAQQLSASLIVLIILVILGVLANGYFYIIQMRVTERMQIRLFSLFSLAYSDRLPKLQQEDINEYHLPETVNRFFDTASIQKGISKILLDLPVASVQIFFGLLLLSFYHAAFILFGLVLILMLYLAIRITGRAGITTSFKESDYKYKVGYWIEEIARNVRTFKLRGHTELPLAKTNSYLEGYLLARNKHFSILQNQFWAFILFKSLITASMLIMGCYLFFNNKINIGQFIASEIIIIMTLSSVEKIITSIDGVYDLLTSLEKASRILDNPIEITNEEKEEKIESLDFEIVDLDFRYPNSARNTLNKISLSIKQGDRIAIVGTKDSGKSTLMRLLTGIYKNFDGAINVNSKPLLSQNLSSVRSKIGAYFSDSEIFEGTLEENLLVGSTSTTAAAIVDIAGEIGLKDFITSDKEGIYKPISTQGKKLPENIKSKILLCRALLKSPLLLLIDDFRHILTKKESSIITKYLLDKKHSYTVLFRTSDEEVMKKCDRVLFMHEGSIIANGSFEEISKISAYREISDQLDEL